MINPRDGMADDDALGPDEDLFDHAAQHFLAGPDRCRVGGVPQSAKESLQVLGKLEIRLPVEELCVQRGEGSAQARFFGSQIGHATICCK